MVKKNLGPKIDESAHKFLGDLFGNPNAGASYVLESFPALYRATLRALKGKFGRGELMLVIDVFNGTMLTPCMAGQHIHASVADGIALDGLDRKWEIDGQGLNDKLRALTPFECATIEIWANMFWYGGREGRDIEGYVAILAEEA